MNYTPMLKLHNGKDIIVTVVIDFEIVLHTVGLQCIL